MKETLSIVINFGVMCITGFYAWLTWHLLKANRDTTTIMQQQFEASIRPHILVDVTLSGGLFVLRIRNLGSTAAENLILSIDKSFYQCGARQEDFNLAKAPAFTKPLRFFTPGAELFFELGSVFFKYDSDIQPGEFDITCRYKYREREIKEVTSIDLNVFGNSALPRNDVVEQLEKLRKSVEDLTKAVKNSAATQ